MVVDALLRAIAETLRSEMGVDDSYVRVMPDPYPIPSMGDWFIAVYGGKFKLVDENTTCPLRGNVKTNLCMTFRHQGVVFDRQGTDLSALANVGMIHIFETALKAIAGNGAIVSTINTALGYAGVESVPILEQPCDFEAKPVRGGGPLGWFNAENQNRAGFILEATFKNYIHIQ